MTRTGETQAVYCRPFGLWTIEMHRGSVYSSARTLARHRQRISSLISIRSSVLTLSDIWFLRQTPQHGQTLRFYLALLRRSKGNSEKMKSTRACFFHQPTPGSTASYAHTSCKSLSARRWLVDKLALLCWARRETCSTHLSGKSVAGGKLWLL